MSLETGVVLDKKRRPIYWHRPSGRTGLSLPDSRELWDVLWGSRHRISGFAHTHPGRGGPWPSDTDISTFFAIERGLGQRLEWWIVDDSGVVLVLTGQRPKRFHVMAAKLLQPQDHLWVAELRRLSRGD